MENYYIVELHNNKMIVFLLQALFCFIEKLLLLVTPTLCAFSWN